MLNGTYMNTQCNVYVWVSLFWQMLMRKSPSEEDQDAYEAVWLSYKWQHILLSLCYVNVGTWVYGGNQSGAGENV